MNLNPKIYNSDIEKLPIRNGFGEGLAELGEINKEVVVLCADLTDSTKADTFKRKFPDRFVEVGITEQSMASVASGMAAMGKTPFILSYAMFNAGRNWEQIRTTICYNNVPVKVVGAHAGVSVGPDGGTHQAIEDIALMRVIPRMVVVVPCDSIEARKATLAIGQTNEPSYIRLAREKSAVITTAETPFAIGKAAVFYESEVESVKKIGIIACGQLVYTSIITAKRLEEDSYQVGVLNLSTIKPLDTETVLAFAKKYNKIITAEEHQIAGGMGSAVAEFLSSEYPVQIGYVGVHDLFGQSGTPEELLNHYGMNVDTIVSRAKSLIQ